MPNRQRDYAREYARRQARARAAGTTVYGRRDTRARERGWRSYNQERYWRGQLTDQRVREIAEEIGGPVEGDRPNALMSREANSKINPYGGDRRGDWRVRLLRTGGYL
jgi:hypothetical protein